MVCACWIERGKGERERGGEREGEREREGGGQSFSNNSTESDHAQSTSLGVRTKPHIDHTHSPYSWFIL